MLTYIVNYPKHSCVFILMLILSLFFSTEMYLSYFILQTKQV